MDNIQLCYIDNEINKIDKMKQGDVIYKNGMELLVVLSYDHEEPCRGCFFYKDKKCGSERLIKCWNCNKEYIFTVIRENDTTELDKMIKRHKEAYEKMLNIIKRIERECQKYVIWDTVHVMLKDMNNKQLYKITLTREQLMLISRCVEDISRYAAGDMDLQHTTETLINDMDRTETLGIRSFIVNNSRAIRRRLFPDLEDYEHIGYDGGSKDMINRKRLIGNTYQIYRSILHQLAIDENWNNVYSDITLPSGDMGTIKVERIDDDKDNDI